MRLPIGNEISRQHGTARLHALGRFDSDDPWTGRYIEHTRAHWRRDPLYQRLSERPILNDGAFGVALDTRRPFRPSLFTHWRPHHLVGHCRSSG
jgi:hypothetical protein